MLEKLLAKEESRKYQLLKRLERSSYFSLTKKELMDALEISNYVLKSTLEQLIQDLEKFGLTEEIQVTLEEPYIQLKITGTANSEALLERYVEESISFNILLAAALGEFKSLNEFSERTWLSYPIAYKSFKLLNSYLAVYKLKIDKKFRLVGECEKNVRLFLTELFSRIYKYDYHIFTHRKNPFVQQIEIKIDDPKMTVHQRINLLHYLYVTDLRINQQKYIEQAPSKVLLEEDIQEFSREFLFQQVQPELRVAEVSAFLTYYYSRSEELGEKLQLIENNSLTTWSKSLLTNLLEYFPQLAENQEKQAYFLKQSYLLHFQIIETSPASETLQPEINIAYFQQNYPMVLEFCHSYVTRLPQQIPELYKKKKQVFFQYLFLILDTFSTDMLIETIKVYVDFSFGSLYNRFITENLNFFHLVGARLITEIESADILLTDSKDLGSVYDKDCVVWLSPPRPLDWANLGQKIIKKRNEKKEYI